MAGAAAGFGNRLAIRYSREIIGSAMTQQTTSTI